jgi:hypothetical protein
MTIDVPAGNVSEKDLVKYRLDIKEHWTPPEGESSELASGFYYIPNFISEQEEGYLIEKVCEKALIVPESVLTMAR